VAALAACLRASGSYCITAGPACLPARPPACRPACLFRTAPLSCLPACALWTASPRLLQVRYDQADYEQFTKSFDYESRPGPPWSYPQTGEGLHAPV